METGLKSFPERRLFLVGVGGGLVADRADLRRAGHHKNRPQEEFQHIDAAWEDLSVGSPRRTQGGGTGCDGGFDCFPF